MLMDIDLHRMSVVWEVISRVIGINNGFLISFMKNTTTSGVDHLFLRDANSGATESLLDAPGAASGPGAAKFAQVRERALEKAGGAQAIPLAGLDEPIKRERAAGRPVDGADIAALGELSTGHKRSGGPRNRTSSKGFGDPYVTVTPVPRGLQL
jgi:hypothetical protein